MRKQSKRRVRHASEPAVVSLLLTPEIGIAERLAIQAMRGGWADYQNSYRILADCHGVLLLGVRKKKDTSLNGVLKLAEVALLNIFDRIANANKVDATGDEIQALELLVDSAEDFWKRQSYAAMQQALAELSFIRAKQIEANTEKRKAA